MKIILSPTKKMIIEEYMEAKSKPIFQNEADTIKSILKQKNASELKQIWKCNDKIVNENIERLHNKSNYLSPAIYSYQGLVFQYLSYATLSKDEMEYINNHLRILSALYGLLRPLDGIQLYRLEMEATLQEIPSFYEYWKDKIYKELLDEDELLINLASKEYSDTILPYLTSKQKVITPYFGEYVNGKLKQKATYAKMMRGEFVRFMAQNHIETIEELKAFPGEYRFNEELSNDHTFYYIKEN